jgi:hypothetical protein
MGMPILLLLLLIMFIVCVRKINSHLKLLQHRHPFNPNMRVTSGVLAEQSVELLKQFFQGRRDEIAKDQLVLPFPPSSSSSKHFQPPIDEDDDNNEKIHSSNKFNISETRSRSMWSKAYHMLKLTFTKCLWVVSHHRYDVPLSQTSPVMKQTVPTYEVVIARDNRDVSVNKLRSTSHSASASSSLTSSQSSHRNRKAFWKGRPGGGRNLPI